ncbi:DNA cytosine methyltransferase [candidate division KSB1 bacterium]|nr:DNA cytosine methyltransferase [candidate division KSB1 bacterium]
MQNNQEQLFKNIPILSFFTGAGFLDMGFEKAGFDIVWTNENNSCFIELYECGYNHWRKAEGIKKDAKIIERRSIESLNSKEIKDRAFGNQEPSIWGVIGGPPCPDFSNSGKNLGFSGEKGRLTQVFIELIINMQPTFFVMENVSGLFRIRKHRLFLEKLRLHLTENRYITDLTILNALQFGVPQDRPRMFLVGMRMQLLNKIIKTTKHYFDSNWFPFPKGKFKNIETIEWPTRNKFGSNVLKPEFIPENLAVYASLSTNPSPEDLPNGMEYFKPHSKKFYEIDEGDTYRKSFKRLHRFRYSPTACYGNNEVHLHPWKARRLSVREVIRIQGIPDTYILPEGGSLTNKFKLISNGVPMPLAFNFAKSLKSFIVKILN